MNAITKTRKTTKTVEDLANLANSPRLLVIQPPKFEMGTIHIVGTTPYVQHKFSEKAREMMEARQRAGSQGEKSRRKRDPKDFEQVYRDAMHISQEGWHGMPASAFRNAMISACKLAGFAMTRAKLSIFVMAQGLDADEGTGLVKIIGEPRIHRGMARNESGVADIRWRPMWEKWGAAVTIRWDAKQFSLEDVGNLMAIAGAQVGIGEGRPDSPNSNGLDWGLWDVTSGTGEVLK